jgi:hypothetical protein
LWREAAIVLNPKSGRAFQPLAAIASASATSYRPSFEVSPFDHRKQSSGLSDKRCFVLFVVRASAFCLAGACEISDAAEKVAGP